MNPRGGESVSKAYYRSEGKGRWMCRVCGEPMGAYHDRARCEERWLKQQDEEATRAREGAKA
jgi:hypothetical protein